jgi:hypothetical protein
MNGMKLTELTPDQQIALQAREGDENLFWIIEALNEQIGSLSYSIHSGIGGDELVEYHLRAVGRYGEMIFQAAAVLLPDLYKASK